MGKTTNQDSGRATLNVSLTPELVRFVEAQVKGGLYSTASEVVREALRMLADREQMRAVRRDAFGQRVRAGVEQLDRGEGIDGDTAFDEIERGLDAGERRPDKA